MAIDARLAYVETDILQADPLRLVQMLYRGALAAIGKARVHILEGDIAGRSRQITKAGEIINELTLSIDRTQGGELAANLVELYDYMQRLLQDANFRQAAGPLTELEGLMSTLLEAWEQCDPGAAVPAPAPPPPAAYVPYSSLDDASHTSYAPARLASYR